MLKCCILVQNPLFSATESAGFRRLREHLTTVKCCISAQGCFFPPQNPLELRQLRKQLNSYGCQKNVNAGARTPVLKGFNESWIGIYKSIKWHSSIKRFVQDSHITSMFACSTGLNPSCTEPSTLSQLCHNVKKMERIITEKWKRTRRGVKTMKGWTHAPLGWIIH